MTITWFVYTDLKLKLHQRVSRASPAPEMSPFIMEAAGRMRKAYLPSVQAGVGLERVRGLQTFATLGLYTTPAPPSASHLIPKSSGWKHHANS